MGFIKDKISVAILDYKGNVSYGRVGGLLCLFSANIMGLAGLFYSGNKEMLSYCSTMGLQFLGAAVSLYGASKASETLNKKWAPEQSETITVPTTDDPKPINNESEVN